MKADEILHINDNDSWMFPTLYHTQRDHQRHNQKRHFRHAMRDNQRDNPSTMKSQTHIVWKDFKFVDHSPGLPSFTNNNLSYNVRQCVCSICLFIFTVSAVSTAVPNTIFSCWHLKKVIYLFIFVKKNHWMSGV